MRHIQTQLQHFQVKKEGKITNERQLLLKDFLERLNPPREQAGYKPLAPACLGVKLAHLNNYDLKVFFGQCNNANNFSAYFWWALK